MLIQINKNVSVVKIEDSVYSVVELFENEYYTYIMDKEEIEDIFNVKLED